MTDTEFEITVRDAAIHQSPSILPNSNKKRAVIVLSNIFKSSKEVVKIFANRFESPICQDATYVLELKEAIKTRNVKVQILFTESPDDSSPACIMLKELLPNYSHCIEMKVISKAAEEEINSKKINSGKPFRFAVADHRMFRYELNTTDYQAYFCFKDFERAKKLENIFDVAFQKSSSV